MNRRMENLKVGDMITSSTPEEMKALALDLVKHGYEVECRGHVMKRTNTLTIIKEPKEGKNESE